MKEQMRKLLRICISILLLVVFIQVLLKLNDYNVILGCGLFAFVGTKSSQFDWMSFNILGVYNDPRGKDSCGRVVNNTVEKGTKKLSKYEDFVEEIPNPNEFITKTVLGHTRKASVGETNIVNAQPVIFKKSSAIVQRMAKKNKKYSKWLKSLKRNSIVFAGIHNGTIYNYKKLAEDYNLSLVDHQGNLKIDSTIIFEILIQEEFDVLAEYVGTAALIFHNYYNNCVYTFKGASSIYSKGNVYEEKPLYRWQQPVGGYYFSSLESSLKFIGGKSKEIIDLSTNVLTKFKNGVIIDEQEIDRTASKQKESIASNSDYSNYGYQSVVHGFRGSNDARITEILFNSNSTSLLFFSNEQNKEWQDEIAPINYLNNYSSTPQKRVMYKKGRYWIDNVLAQGLIITNEFGWIHMQTEDIKTVAVINYFVDGILMDDDSSFFQALGIRLKSNFPEHTDTIKQLVKLSRYPICPLDKTINELEDAYNPFSAKFNGYYSGVINPIYAKRRYSFTSGNLDLITELQSIKESTSLIQKALVLVILKDYKQHFQRKLAKYVTSDVCKESDHINKVLMTILKSGGYFISTKLNKQTEEESEYPNIDFKELKKALKTTRKSDIQGLLGEYNPCLYCDFEESDNKCDHCPIQKEYADLRTKYNSQYSISSEDTITTTPDNTKEVAIEKQLTAEAITGLSDKLMGSVKNTESELFALGNTDLVTEFADMMNEIKTTLLKFENK